MNLSRTVVSLLFSSLVLSSFMTTTAVLGQNTDVLLCTFILRLEGVLNAISVSDESLTQEEIRVNVKSQNLIIQAINKSKQGDLYKSLKFVKKFVQARGGIYFYDVSALSKQASTHARWIAQKISRLSGIPEFAAKQARMYVKQGIARANDEAYTESVIDFRAAVRIILVNSDSKFLVKPNCSKPTGQLPLSKNGQWKILGQNDLFGDNKEDSGLFVSLSKTGNVMAVATVNNKVLVYRLRSSPSKKWVQMGQELVTDQDVYFSPVSINGSGDILAVINDGRGYVYKYDMASELWVQYGKEIVGDDWDGAEMNEAGDVVALGNSNFSFEGGAHAAGSVSAFRLNPDSLQWEMLRRPLYGTANYETLGAVISLSSSGMIMALGTGLDFAEVYKYDSTSAKWVRMGERIGDDGTGNPFDTSLVYVSLDSTGEIVALGASVGTRAGFAYVYAYDKATDSWYQRGRRISSGRRKYWIDRFGYSISLCGDGNVLAVGARRYARIYQYDEFNTSQWIQVGKTLVARDEEDYGSNLVSLSGNGTVVAVRGPLAHLNRKSKHVRTYEFVTN